MPERKTSRTVSALATIKTFGRCCYCGCKLNEENFSVEHIEPFSESEDSSIGNAMVACKSCNSLRSDHSLKVFRERLANDVRKSGIDYLNSLVENGTIANSNAIATLKYYFQKTEPSEVKFYYEKLSHACVRFINSILEDPENWKQTVFEKADKLTPKEEAPESPSHTEEVEINTTVNSMCTDFENVKVLVKARVYMATPDAVSIKLEGCSHVWRVTLDKDNRLRLEGYGTNLHIGAPPEDTTLKSLFEYWCASHHLDYMISTYILPKLSPGMYNNYLKE